MGFYVKLNRNKLLPVRGTNSLKNKRISLDLLFTLICFVLFAVNMLYSKQYSILILIGILGLVGMNYFIFRFFLTECEIKYKF